MRAKTTLAQCLPTDMEDKILTFHRFVITARRRCEYPLSHIINMDETPMQFELPATRTHPTDCVKELLALRNVDVAVIPGGLTPVLQPLNKN